jgi:hypothetical protein
VDVVAVLAESVFSIANYERLNRTGRVVGMVILYDSNGTTSLAPFSPDFRFPNGAAFPFNAAGVQPGFMFQPFRVPLFSCRDDETSLTVLGKANDNVARQFAYPQWGAKLNAHMDAGVNAENCLRRKFCQPLGGQSVWAARRPLVRPDAPAPDNATDEWLRARRPLVVLSTGFDSNSIFQDVAIGARSDMAPLIVALATLDALANSGINDSVWDEAPRQPLFTFFTGEAWNQMGSKAFFRDVAKFDCESPSGQACLKPFVTTRDFQDISIDNIALMMHLSSDLGVTEAQQVFWHIGNGTDSRLAALVRQELALSTTVRAPSANVTSLPPSALVEARRHRPQLPGVVLGGFDDRFNSRYHSRLDDARGAITKFLCPTAGAVARAFVAALLVNDSASAPPARDKRRDRGGACQLHAGRSALALSGRGRALRSAARDAVQCARAQGRRAAADALCRRALQEQLAARLLGAVYQRVCVVALQAARWQRVHRRQRMRRRREVCECGMRVCQCTVPRRVARGLGVQLHGGRVRNSADGRRVGGEQLGQRPRHAAVQGRQRERRNRIPGVWHCVDNW